MKNDEKSMKIIKNPSNHHQNLPKTTKNLKIDHEKLKYFDTHSIKTSKLIKKYSKMVIFSENLRKASKFLKIHRDFTQICPKTFTPQ